MKKGRTINAFSSEWQALFVDQDLKSRLSTTAMAAKINVVLIPISHKWFSINSSHGILYWKI